MHLIVVLRNILIKVKYGSALAFSLYEYDRRLRTHIIVLNFLSELMECLNYAIDLLLSW
jgi:hypothetical protein